MSWREMKMKQPELGSNNQSKSRYTEGDDWPRGLSFAVLMSCYLRNQVNVEPASFLFQLGVADFLPGWL